MYIHGMYAARCFNDVSIAASNDGGIFFFFRLSTFLPFCKIHSCSFFFSFFERWWFFSIVFFFLFFFDYCLFIRYKYVLGRFWCPKPAVGVCMWLCLCSSWLCGFEQRIRIRQKKIYIFLVISAHFSFDIHIHKLSPFLLGRTTDKWMHGLWCLQKRFTGDWCAHRVRFGLNSFWYEIKLMLALSQRFSFLCNFFFHFSYLFPYPFTANGWKRQRESTRILNRSLSYRVVFMVHIFTMTKASRRSNGKILRIL